MAVLNINYEDKEGLQNDASIPRKNKATDDDFNEIKQVVNNNATELNTAQENIENLEEQQGDSNAEIIQLKNRTSALETDNTTNKANIQSLQADNMQNKTDISQIKQNIQTLQQEQQTQNKNISNLQKDNTKNKEDIAELQQNKETVNTQIQTLQEEIKELEQDVKANAVIKETEQAKSLYISDASGARGKLDVLGNVEQEVTETSPSINYPSPLKILGDNINVFDGEVEIGFIDSNTGQNSAQDNVWRSKNYININNKDISLSIEKLKYTGSVGRVLYYKGDNTYLSSAQINSIPFSLKLPEETSKIRFYILDSVAPLGSKVKIEEGSIATSYSPYGQGSTEVNIENGNLFDGKWEIGSINVDTGNNWNTDVEIRTEYIRIEPNTDYTASRDTTENVKIRFYDKDKNYLGSGAEQGISYAGKKVYTFKSLENAKYIRFNIGSTDLNYRLQLEKGSTATDFVEHQEQNYILDIQQPMLTGDYFDLERKKEVHNLGHYKFTGDENFKKRGVYNNLNVFYLEGADVPFMYKLQTYTKSGISNASKTAKSISYASNGTIEEGIQLYYNSGNPARAFYISFKDIETVEDLKAKIKEIDFYYYYEVEEPTELDLTESQIQTLEQLNKLRLYKGVNNIFTTEDIALLQAEYGVDIQTKINNVISTQLSQIGGN